MPGGEISIAAAKEHIGEVKCKFWVVKERCRDIMATLPFKLLPDLRIPGFKFMKSSLQIKIELSKPF